MVKKLRISEGKYITSHGIGPGTLPKDVTISDVINDDNGYTTFTASRDLTKQEMDRYDVRYANEHDDPSKAFGVFMMTVDVTDLINHYRGADWKGSEFDISTYVYKCAKDALKSDEYKKTLKYFDSMEEADKLFDKFYDKKVNVITKSGSKFVKIPVMIMAESGSYRVIEHGMFRISEIIDESTKMKHSRFRRVNESHYDADFMGAFIKKFGENYNFIYNSRDIVAGYDEALEFGDEYIRNPKNKDFIKEFNEIRQDFLSSDRDVVAFAFTLADFDMID